MYNGQTANASDSESKRPLAEDNALLRGRSVLTHTQGALTRTVAEGLRVCFVTAVVPCGRDYALFSLSLRCPEALASLSQLWQECSREEAKTGSALRCKHQHFLSEKDLGPT